MSTLNRLDQETIDAFDQLGEPLASYARALIRADDARKRLLAAQVAGNINERTDAELDRERAVGDVMAIKEKWATAWLTAARWAAELYPTVAQSHLDPVFRRELDNTQAAVVNVTVELDALKQQVGKGARS